jgi:hypothetical protein
MQRWRRYAVPVLIFCLVFTLHARAGIFVSADSRWSIHAAMSIIQQGNTDLNEYAPLLAEHHQYGIETINGHQFSIFPVGVSLLAVPFVWINWRVIGPVRAIDVQSQIAQTIPSRVEGVIASFFVALTAAVLYMIGRRQLSTPSAVALASIFAFCTPAWSTASRALWQHGPSMFMLSMVLLLVLRAREHPAMIQFVSLPLAMAFVIRPTNSIAVVLFSAYVLVFHHRFFMRYVLWSLVIAVPFLVFNWNVYGALVSPYYRPQRVGGSPYFAEALAGNLISPARGLLVFSPVFLCSFVGVWLKIGGKALERIDYVLVAVIVLHWLLISSFKHWYGGHSFGPRLFSDMTPFLVYFLVPVFATLEARSSNHTRTLAAALLGLSTISFAIHARGATDIATWYWNGIPTNVDAQPERIWDWRDLQFLRGTRFQPKIGL